MAAIGGGEQVGFRFPEAAPPRETVEGTVTLNRSEGAFAEASRVTGNIQANDAAFVGFSETTVGGDIQAERRTEFAADRLTINSNLQAAQVRFVDLLDSTVNGSFTVQGALREAQSGCALATERGGA